MYSHINIHEFVDTFDIVTAVLRVVQESKTVTIKDGVQVQWKSWCKDLHKLEHQGKSFFDHSVRYFINLSKLNPLSTIKEDATLSSLLEKLSEGTNRHRVLVVNDLEEPIAVISQSALLRFIAKNSNRIENTLLHANIDTVQLATKNPISVSYEADAVHAVHVTREAGVPAVAVVGKNGALVATFSVSDAKGLLPEYFGDLTRNVMSFLTTHSEPKLPPFTCRGSCTVEEVLMKMVALEVHRLWMVDERERPTGVVSLTDVIRFLYYAKK